MDSLGKQTRIIEEGKKEVFSWVPQAPFKLVELEIEAPEKERLMVVGYWNGVQRIMPSDGDILIVDVGITLCLELANVVTTEKRGAQEVSCTPKGQFYNNPVPLAGNGERVRRILINAAKRNHNTAQQVRDLLEEFKGPKLDASLLPSLAGLREDAVAAEAEARKVLEQLRSEGLYIEGTDL